MNKPAHVTSIESVREFRAAMQKFEMDTHSGLTMLKLELRRAVQWIEHDRTQYWPQQVREAYDKVAEARVSLERCELRAPDGTRSSCYDEKKALDRAKRRVRLAQEKVEAVRHWKNVIRKETEEFNASLAKLDFYLESDWAKALASIGRMIAALERYAEAASPTATGPKSSPARNAEAADSEGTPSSSTPDSTRSATGEPGE